MHLAFYSLLTSPCVPLYLSLYQSVCSPVLREILTDPLEELRDSIRKQQNRTVVLRNLEALER